MKVPRYWQIFRIIEADFLKLGRYVEISSDNFKTYSVELRHLLLLAGSEVDVLCKRLCRTIDPNRTVRQTKTIIHYRDVIRNHCRHFHSTDVGVLPYGITVRPWEAWRVKSSDDSPHWWTAYNDVKHDNERKFHQANLKNCL